MPAFQICGRTYLIAPDDFVFFIPGLIPLHALWAFLNYSNVVEGAMELIQCPPEFRLYDAILCVATIPIDFVISLLSACGPIMKPRCCSGLFKCLVIIRLLFAVPILVNFALVMRYAIVYFISAKDDLGKELERDGWGPELQEKWDVYMILILIAWRFLWYASSIGFVIILLVPKFVREEVLSLALRTVLFLLGCRDNMINSLMSIIMNDLGGTTTLQEVAPSDWIFGLFLAAARQQQGFLGYDPDATLVPAEDEEEGNCALTRPARRSKRLLPPTVKRASLLRGVLRPTSALDPASPEDHAVMNEIVRLMPYASGIYGQQFGMSCIKDSVEPGTHLPTICRTCRSCCSACPCTQAHACDSSWECLRRLCCCVCCYYCCNPGGHTEDDFSSALNEDALRRALQKGAKRSKGAVPELVWASWRNMGPATSPPIGVLVDHQRQEVIVTVRGTADVKDCIADAGAKPLFFDPFNWAKEGDRRSPPFDSNEDLFVHGTMLLCAEDAHHRLRHKRILEDLLARECRGYGVVCVGHSLGAGVACLLALILKQYLKEASSVRYVGFEPPGGLLCQRISAETQRLGWLAVVCSHDWVPRIGIRNLQKLKVLALDELYACNRSKLQLSFLLGSGILKQIYPLCCLRRPLAAVFRCLGGGALEQKKPAKRGEQAPLVAGKASHFSTEVTFPDLWPPGDLVYFRPLEAVFRCGYMFEKDTEWTAEWADPQDLDELVLTARAIDLHVPWVYEDAIENVAEAFEEEAGSCRKAANAKDQRGGLCSRSQRQGSSPVEPDRGG